MTLMIELCVPLALQVLVNKKEISGEEIDFIVNNYPAHTPASHILEETDPGALPFFKQEQQEGSEKEYNLLSTW